MHGGIALASFQNPAGQTQSDGEVEPAGLVPVPPHVVHIPEPPHEFSTHEHDVIAVEPAALTALLPHDVQIPPTTLGLPHEFSAHEHAVIAVEPAALTALLPHGTQGGVALGSYHELAAQLHAEGAVDPLGAGLDSDPHAMQMGVAPDVSLKVPSGQSAVVGRQRLVSHIVPTPQSEELTAQNEDGFSPVATQQQRRA